MPASTANQSPVSLKVKIACKILAPDVQGCRNLSVYMEQITKIKIESNGLKSNNLLTLIENLDRHFWVHPILKSRHTAR